MTEQDDPQGRYEVFSRLSGDRIGEMVKGVLYEGPPEYRQKVGTVGLAFVHHCAQFDLAFSENVSDLE